MTELVANALIIRPTDITAAMLVSSNAVDEYDLWDDGENASGWHTLYLAGLGGGVGDIVRSPSADNHRLYEAIAGPFNAAIVDNITIADPAVCTVLHHGLEDGDVVTFIDTNGTLPASVYMGVPYIITKLSDDTFKLGSNSNPASYVDTTGETNTGLHTIAKGDPNTGYWGDPGDPEFGVGGSVADINYPPYEWATSPRWRDIGPTNSWAMFDALNGSATVWDGDGEIELEFATRIDAAGFEGLIGSSLRLVMLDGVTTEYDRTVSLVDNGEVIDYYTFFFGERAQRSTVVLDDLPAWVLAPAISVTIEAAGDLGSACATAQFGRQFSLGSVEQGLGLSIDDFTFKDRDDFGNFDIVERDYSKSAEARALLPNSRRPRVTKVLAAHRAIPVFWKLGDDEDQQIFGFFRRLEAEEIDADRSTYIYEIEGLN